MIDWYRLRDLLYFWLPPCVGVAITFFLIAKGADLINKVRRDREISSDVRKAYRYFKHLVETQRKEDKEREDQDHT